MFEIPTSVTIGSEQLNIRKQGDYRMILDCFAALNDVELTEQERLFSALIIFYERFDDLEDLVEFKDLNQAVEEMFKFFNCGTNEIGSKRAHKLIDWQKDEQLIASAINNVANTEIRALPYVHWWTFMGYYLAIGESPLSTVVGIRSKIAEGKKLEKYESKFKQDNPHYFIWDYKTTKEKEIEQQFRDIWNSGN